MINYGILLTLTLSSRARRICRLELGVMAIPMRARTPNVRPYAIAPELHLSETGKVIQAYLARHYKKSHK
jgi:hypothetical protein